MAAGPRHPLLEASGIGRRGSFDASHGKPRGGRAAGFLSINENEEPPREDKKVAIAASAPLPAPLVCMGPAIEGGHGLAVAVAVNNNSRELFFGASREWVGGAAAGAGRDGVGGGSMLPLATAAAAHGVIRKPNSDEARRLQQGGGHQAVVAPASSRRAPLSVADAQAAATQLEYLRQLLAGRGGSMDSERS